MSGAGSLILYDAMCVAIAEAFAVDEVKDIRDRAMACEAYARQARNTEAERKACEIRLRAERRCGQILREREMAKGARGNPGGQGAPIVQSHAATAQPKPLADLGVSKTQSSRWQKLAAISDEDFEATFAGPGVKPSTSGIIATHSDPIRPPPVIIEAEPEPLPVQPPASRQPVDPRALWLWGRLMDFERDGLLATDPNRLMSTAPDHMKVTINELAPVVAAWLQRIAP